MIAARKAAEARAAAMAAAANEPAEIMDASDAAVQRALVVGDYRGAVAACVAAGRHADALVLAHAGGAELWEETRAAHIAANVTRPYMRVASAIVSDDLGALVKSRPLAKWRETLAILCTYAPAEDWGTLAGVLAGRLADAGDAHASTLCHICAGDVDAAVRHWMSALPPGKVSAPAVHAVLEKAVVLTRATGRASGAGLSQLVVSYAEMLASRGQLSSAISYLDMVPDGGEAVTTLRDRIVRGGAGKLASSSAPAAVSAPAAPAPAAPAPRRRARAAANRVRRIRAGAAAATQTSGHGGYDAGAQRWRVRRWRVRTVAVTAPDVLALRRRTHAASRAVAERLRRVQLGAGAVRARRGGVGGVGVPGGGSRNGRRVRRPRALLPRVDRRAPASLERVRRADDARSAERVDVNASAPPTATVAASASFDPSASAPRRPPRRPRRPRRRRLRRTARNPGIRARLPRSTARHLPGR